MQGKNIEWQEKIDENCLLNLFYCIQSYIYAYSNLRQVPDNQEVLLSQSNDLTMIVEVLEGVKEGSASNDFEAAIR